MYDIEMNFALNRTFYFLLIEIAPLVGNRAIGGYSKKIGEGHGENS